MNQFLRLGDKVFAAIRGQSLPFLILFMTPLLVRGQQPLIHQQLSTGTADTLNLPSFEEGLISENTDYYIGNFNAEIAQFEMGPPTSEVFPNTQFSLKKRATMAFDLNAYPVRTALKIFIVEDDSLIHNCTASMISKRHALTAAHCLVAPDGLVPVDSVLVCPIYDNGTFNQNFQCSYVASVYFFRDHRLAAGEDFLVMELQDAIGIETGWLGIGYHQNEQLLSDRIFYRFSYPGVSIPAIDPNNYNGDTLYFNYGLTDLFEENFIGITNANAVPGESGSALVDAENFLIYGVTTFSNDLRNSRLINWQYHAIKEIIEDDLTVVLDANEMAPALKVFPNPTADLLNVQSNQVIEEVTILDIKGQVRQSYAPQSRNFSLQVAVFNPGVYFLKVRRPDKILIRRILIR